MGPYGELRAVVGVNLPIIPSPNAEHLGESVRARWPNCFVSAMAVVLLRGSRTDLGGRIG